VVNDANVARVVAAGGVASVLRGAGSAGGNAPLLAATLTVLEAVCRHEGERGEVVAGGGVNLVMDEALGRHLGVEAVASRGVSLLADLSVTPGAADAIKAKDPGGLLERAMKEWRGAPRILESCMRLMSNLVHVDMECNEALGAACGGTVVGVVRDNARDAGLLRMSLRALGNLACCDANIRALVESSSAAKAVVAGMRAHGGDEDIIRAGVEVLGNLAGGAEAEVEVDEYGVPLEDRASIAATIQREAGCAEVIAALQRPSARVPLVLAALRTLANLAGDAEVTEFMVERQALLPAVLGVMARYDWDGGVVAAAAAVLAAVSYAEVCLPTVAAAGTVEALLAAVVQHTTNPDLLSSVSDALLNLATDADCRAALREADGPTRLVAVLEANAAVKPFVVDMVALLAALAADADLSGAVGAAATGPLLAALARYQRDPAFVTDVLRLITTLSYVPANLTVLVQLNGIQAIIAAITVHPEHQPLILRGIQTLDAIALTSKENAAIVIEEGGRDLIQAIMAQEPYTTDDEVQRFGKSALVSMAALEQQTKSVEMTARAARAAALRKAAGVSMHDLARPADPLADVRNMLTVGKIMKLWTKGSANAVHVLMPPDATSLAWQDIKTTKKLGAADFSTVSGVRLGCGDGHKKTSALGTKLLDEATCFVLATRSGEVCLECTTARDANAWVDALQRALHEHRTRP